MYKEYFGFKELPFSIAPDPRYIYMSGQHREALAHLLYGVKTEGGFVLLTGEIGTGKTTICRCLFEQTPKNTDIAFILNPKVSAGELLATICDELRIPYPDGNQSVKVFVDRINGHLLDSYSKGRRTILIIEEAQNLSPDVLEQIRLLTNLETDRQKLLQIIMVGQPELRDMLARSDLEQLSQRITARYHLGPITEKEVGEYVNHRLAVAGAKEMLFPEELTDTLYRLSRGIPRLINVICDRALLGIYVKGRKSVDKETLLNAAGEVLSGSGAGARRRPIKKWIASGLFLVFGASLAILFYLYNQPEESPLLALSEGSKSRANASNQNGAASFIWPADYPIKKSRQIALEVLLKRWEVPVQGEDQTNRCRIAQNSGLSCLEGMAGIEELRRMDRPAVLKLYDGRGEKFYAALVGLQDRTAAFSVGSKTMIVDLAAVKKQWLGEYALLWRPPGNYEGSIRPGDKGEQVVWLNRQLSSLTGSTAREQQKDEYTDSLVKEVKKFQIANGLMPDGIVGPQTIIRINNAVGSDEPRLVRKREK
ncbi:MAG: AAA family ATPase [Nitrospirota bacterium]